MYNLCYNISISLWGDVGVKKSKYAVVVFALLVVGLLSIYKINGTVKEAEQQPFNYSYMVYSQNKDNLKAYKSWFPDYISLTWETKQFITPDENMITYQQAANIAGEALKNFYGVTEHTHISGVIQLYNHVVYNSLQPDPELVVSKSNTGYSQPHRYVYMFIDSNNMRYNVYVDRYNGVVFNIFDNETAVAGEEVPITSDETQIVESMVKNCIQFLGINTEITRIDVTHTINITGLNRYYAEVFLADGYVADVTILKPAGEDYRLSGFQLNSPLD